MFQRSLRNLWDQDVIYNNNLRKNKSDLDSIEQHCEKSDYKYFVHFISGQINNFSQFENMNFDNAVSIDIYNL